MTNGEYTQADNAPFCGTDRGQVEVTLPDGDGDTVTGYVLPEDARQVTGALRACASSIDGEDYFKGGWSNAEALRAIATDYTKLVEGDGSDL